MLKHTSNEVAFGTYCLAVRDRVRNRHFICEHSSRLSSPSSSAHKAARVLQVPTVSCAVHETSFSQTVVQETEGIFITSLLFFFSITNHSLTWNSSFTSRHVTTLISLSLRTRATYVVIPSDLAIFSQEYISPLRP